MRVWAPLNKETSTKGRRAPCRVYSIDFPARRPEANQQHTTLHCILPTHCHGYSVAGSRDSCICGARNHPHTNPSLNSYGIYVSILKAYANIRRLATPYTQRSASRNHKTQIAVCCAYITNASGARNPSNSIHCIDMGTLRASVVVVISISYIAAYRRAVTSECE